MPTELNHGDTNRSTIQSRPQSKTQNAALTGASLAFSSKPPVKPKPNTNAYNSNNEALAAATKVGGRSLSPSKGSEQWLRNERTGESSTTDAGSSSEQHRVVQKRLKSNGLLQPPGNTTDVTRSPAFMAANLAASRSASNSPNHTGKQQQSHQQSPILARRLSYASSIDSLDRRPDVTSIPPTSSLVGMFEQNATATAQKKPIKRPKTPIPRPTSSASSLALGAPVKLTPTKPSAKPPAELLPRRASIIGESESIQNSTNSTRRPVSHHGLPTPRPISSHNPPAFTKFSPKPQVPRQGSWADQIEQTATATSLKRPTTPAPRPKSAHAPAPPKSPKPPLQPPRTSTSTNTTKSPAPKIASKSPKPKPTPPISRSKPPINHTQNNDPDDGDASSNDSFVSASSQRQHLPPESWRADLARQNQKQKEKHRRPSSSPGSMDASALANAIVASSLASSRASPSSTLLPPPAPPTRRHLFHHHHNNYNNLSSTEISRTPSPARNPPPVAHLKTTMRKPHQAKEEVDEGEKRRNKKHRLVKKHPNKHHEGDRKRWRDTLSERERKRYEAVWASNKGLFPEYWDEEYGEMRMMEGAGESVCGLVVRDVWERSRLEGEVLGEVWDLVVGKAGGGSGWVEGKGGAGYAGQGSKRLEREEFVVGMWLIDQRLKGRKLPIRVSDSVWRSVGTLGGIKIRGLGK